MGISELHLRTRPAWRVQAGAARQGRKVAVICGTVSVATTRQVNVAGESKSDATAWCGSTKRRTRLQGSRLARSGSELLQNEPRCDCRDNSLFRQTTRPGFKNLLPVSIAVVFTLKNTGQGVYIELLGEDGVQSLRRYAARDLQQICHGNFANFAHSAALWASPDLLGLPGRGPRYGTPAGIRYATVRLRE